MSGFSFGSAGGNGSSNMFGSNNAQTGSSGLFGASATPSTSSTFGQTSTATSQPANTGLFGSGSTPAPAFGLGGATSGTTTPSLFGTSTGNAPAGGLFGNKPASTSAPSGQGLFSSAAIPAPFGSNPGGFSFGQRKDDGIAGSNEKTAPATGGGQFGALNTSSAPNISVPAGTTTPAKTSFSYGNSTTPAGPPPANDGQKAANNLFGGAAGGAGSSNLFGGIKNVAAPVQTTSSLFSSTSTPTIPGGMFGAAPSKPAGPGMFSNLNSSTPSTSGPTAISAATKEAPKAFSFPSSTPASTTSTQQSSGTPAPSNLFSAPKPTAGSSAPALSMANLFSGAKPASTTSAPAASPNLFGNNNVTTTSTSTEPTKTTAPSLFGGLAASTAATTAATPNTTAPATTAPASLFGSSTVPAATQPSTSSTTTATAATAATGSTSTNPTQNASNFGNSTVGPTPQSARLKNKTMDEIITRWASDLSKYQKEFQTQAAKVAAWDRLMVDNGDKIQKLYVETHEAERHHAEIERQLTNVEGQQDELTSWLDRYEADVDEMFQRQVAHGDSLQGPDQERERTYKLAERLTDKLDGMGKELTTMIEAINDASTTLSKTSKSDDPLSHIVRVLNSHLTQLQWIDENATALQSKLAGAEKMSASIGPNGYGGPESDAADSFYRSLLGRK